jgi:3-methyladenine DNA glycosylase AlkD
MKTDIIEKLKTDLEAVATEQNRIAGERFFKEKLTIIGVKSKDLRAVSKSNYQLVKLLNKKELFAICEELWQTGVLELSFVAADWSLSRKKDFEKSDFDTFERWVSSYINNWASCDTFCNHNMGEIVVMYPEFLSKLKEWALSDNRWVKRAAAVSLIVPAKKGKFLKDVFEIADILLLDKDDMVQKGYGWMLKVASQAHLKEVFDYVIKNKAVMPRTALRYAIEKMPTEFKVIAMKK